MTIKARYPGLCPNCKEAIRPGQDIEWTKGKPAFHSACPKHQAELKAKAFAEYKRIEQITWNRREAYRKSGGYAHIVIDQSFSYPSWDIYVPDQGAISLTDKTDPRRWQWAYKIMSKGSKEKAIEWCVNQGYKYFF